MTMAPDRMWDLLVSGSDELAEELGLEESPFAPRSLRAIDGWVRDHGAPLEEEEVTRLGLFLARLLIESHGGGLVVIHEEGHALDGEWAITGFAKGLDNDYHVPFLVSAMRIGGDRSLTATAWYEQALREGRSAGPPMAAKRPEPRRDEVRRPPPSAPKRGPHRR